MYSDRSVEYFFLRIYIHVSIMLLEVKLSEGQNVGKKIYIPQYTHLLSFLLWLLFLQLIKQSTSEKSVPIFLINFGNTYMIKMHSLINVWRFVGTNIRYVYALLRWRHIPAQTIYFLPSSEMVEWFFRLWTFCNE